MQIFHQFIDNMYKYDERKDKKNKIKFCLISVKNKSKQQAKGQICEKLKKSAKNFYPKSKSMPFFLNSLFARQH